MDRLTNYPGQKWGIADKIISYFPKHQAYFEPFFGAGSVFFSKPRVRMEVINDLDGDVVNLLRQFIFLHTRDRNFMSHTIVKDYLILREQGAF